MDIEAYRRKLEELFGGTALARATEEMNAFNQRLAEQGSAIDVSTAAGQRLAEENRRLIESYLALGGTVEGIPPKMEGVDAAFEETCKTARKEGDCIAQAMDGIKNSASSAAAGIAKSFSQAMASGASFGQSLGGLAKGVGGLFFFTIK